MFIGVKPEMEKSLEPNWNSDLALNIGQGWEIAVLHLMATESRMDQVSWEKGSKGVLVRRNGTIAEEKF